MNYFKPTIFDLGSELGDALSVSKADAIVNEGARLRYALENFELQLPEGADFVHTLCVGLMRGGDRPTTPEELASCEADVRAMITRIATIIRRVIAEAAAGDPAAEACATPHWPGVGSIQWLLDTVPAPISEEQRAEMI